MGKIKIKTLDAKKWFVQKTISIQQKQNDRIVCADIVYFRRINNSNIKTEKNRLDDIILDSIRKVYPNAQSNERFIIFDVDVDDVRQKYSQKKSDKFEITLTCDISGIEHKDLKELELFGYRFALDLYYEESFAGDSKLSNLGSVNYCLSVENNEKEIESLEDLYNNSLCNLEDLEK